MKTEMFRSCVPNATEIIRAHSLVCMDIACSHTQEVPPKNWIDSIKEGCSRIEMTLVDTTRSAGRRFSLVGNDVGQIDEVVLRRIWLVLGWVTVSGFNSQCRKFISL